jgi:hypothetical protein
MLSHVLCPLIPGVGTGYIEGTPNASAQTGRLDRLTRAAWLGSPGSLQNVSDL